MSTLTPTHELLYVYQDVEYPEVTIHSSAPVPNTFYRSVTLQGALKGFTNDNIFVEFDEYTDSGIKKQYINRKFIVKILEY